MALGRPKRLRRRPQESSKTVPDGRQDCQGLPRWPTRCLHHNQDSTKRAQDGPKTAQNGLKMVQHGLDAPNAPARPRRSQCASKTAQKTSNRTSRKPEEAKNIDSPEEFAICSGLLLVGPPRAQTPRMAPRAPKKLPRRLQDGPRGPRTSPRELQDGPIWPPKRPR